MRSPPRSDGPGRMESAEVNSCLQILQKLAFKYYCTSWPKFTPTIEVNLGPDGQSLVDREYSAEKWMIAMIQHGRNPEIPAASRLAAVGVDPGNLSDPGILCNPVDPDPPDRPGYPRIG